jgi:hypothetical protein
MKPTVRLAFFGATLASSLASACGPYEPSGTPGALKEGGFTYCSGALPSCSSASAVPDHLAVASTFTIQFSGNDNVTLSSSDSGRLRKMGTNDDGSASFRVVGSGSAQVEARVPSDSAQATTTDELLDFVRLDLQDIDSLIPRLCPRAFNAIASSASVFDPADCGGETEGTTGIDISQGSSLAPTVCAFPIGSSGDDLRGNLAFDWVVDPGATAELELFVGTDASSDETKGAGRCATIGGLTVGTANVTVRAGSASSAIAVTVNR